MWTHGSNARSLSRRRFLQDETGSVAATFVLTLIPIMLSIGAALDYTRASSTKAVLQSTLDSALLAGAKDGSSSWSQTALNVFQGNFSQKSSANLTPTFTQDTDGTYRASVQLMVPTAVLKIAHIDTLQVTATAAAKASDPDNSCILTLDHGQSASHVSLTLNGAPIVNLTGCSIRANTSLNCNGHDGSVTKGIASGTASNCGIPKSYAPTVPDVYLDLKNNITTQCGTSRPGLTWPGGSIPTGAGIITVSRTGYTEYHVCGDLTLTGSGYLTGSSPTSDSVIIVENGSITIANNASINTLRTAIVMTGNNSYASIIDFPNGSGKQATLSLSPPLDAANPWQGVSLYEDPRLTYQVNNTWGPGANFNADGLVYLGNSNVVTDGDTSSANSKCTKFVMNQFTTNGHVDLNMSQSTATCAAIGLKQWTGIVVHLVQ